jgi:hypothetical protein
MSAEYVTRDAVLAALSRHIGAGNGVTVLRLTAEALGGPLWATEGAQRQVRRMVQELREAGHHVCADPQHGYYIAATQAELDATCEHLHARAMCSLRQIAAMRRVSEPDLRGQLRLPAEPQED